MSVSKYISIRFSSVLCWGVLSGAFQTYGLVGVRSPVVSSSPQLPLGTFEACTKPSPVHVLLPARPWLSCTQLLLQC